MNANISPLLLNIQSKVSKFLFTNKSLWIFNTIISIAWIGAFVGAYSHNGIDWKEVIKHSGELAWKLLIFIIFVSLFQKILRVIAPKITIFSALLPLRKSAGIFMFLIALSHGISVFAKNNFQDIWNTIIRNDHAEIFGTIAFILALPVFLTSTQQAVKKMGFKTWKRLQKITHIVFVFSALHFILIDFFIKGKIEGGPILALFLYVGGYGYLYWQKKQKVNG